MTIAWVICGGGLLGKSLSTALALHNIKVYEPLGRFSWNDNGSLYEEFLNEIQIFSGLAIEEDRWQIYWAAGLGNMHSTDEDLATETNTLANFVQLLISESGLKFGDGSFIFSSSAGAIYAASTDRIIDENSDPATLNSYGKYKLEQERIVSTLSEVGRGITVLLARISTIFGVAQSSKKNQGLLTEIVDKALRGDVIHIYVPLQTMRDYISVDEAAQIMVITALSIEGEEAVFVKIVASGKSISIAEIISIFKRLIRKNIKVVTRLSSSTTSYKRIVQFRSTRLTNLAPKSNSNFCIEAAKIVNYQKSIIGLQKIRSIKK